MTGMEMFFLICAVVGGVLFLARLVLLFLGAGDGHDDISVTHDVGPGDSDVGFKLISLQAVMAFFLMFGLVGFAMLRASHLHFLWALLGGTAAGGLSVALIAKIFSMAKRLQSSGTLNMENAIGQEATVYLKIPPGGTGKVQVAVQGRLETLEARSEAKEEIRSGERVKVTAVAGGGMLMVQKL